MIEIRITLNNGQDVWLVMPSSSAEMAETYAAFGNAVNEGKQIRDAKSPVGNLSGHLRGITVTSRVLEELVFLNQRIEGMTEQEREIFGAMLEIEKPSGQDRHWSRYTMASICLIPAMRRTACLL